MKAWLLWLLGVGLLFVPAFPDPPLHSGAYLQHVTRDSAVIARIEPVPRALALEVATEDGRVVHEPQLSEPRRRHAFAVHGLAPGTAYRYELRDANGQRVDGGEFHTPPADDTTPVHFLVVGDSGGLPWWVWLQNDPLFYAAARYDLLPVRASVALTGARMASEHPDLWFHVGDVVYPRGEQRHYAPGFFRPFADLLRQAPCYLVLGNHDIMQDDGRQLLKNFDLPVNDVTGDERFFRVSWGSVRFVGLDLAPPVTADHPALEFLDHAFAGAGEPWRIAFAHYPFRSASRQGDRQDLIQNLLPSLRRHQVDLMFVGHDHNYQRFGAPDRPQDGPLLVVTGGGGKSLYKLKVHPDLAKAYRGFHYCRAVADGAVLRVTAVADDGSEIETFELDARRRRSGPAMATDPERLRRIRALVR